MIGSVCGIAKMVVLTGWPPMGVRRVSSVVTRIFGIMVTVAAVSAAARAEPDLVTRALALGLDKKPMWAALLHLSGMKQSYIDGDSFFLSQREGSSLPEHELAATVQQLFIAGNVEAQCRFIARYFWLSEQLFGRAAYPRCPEFEEWLGGIDPLGLTLVFADAFPNNPASMFGHTFLRIDARSKMPLLSYAIQYGADAAADPGLIYALKGIFGGYQGQFTVMPYYKGVEQYGNIEDRDLWEYQLSYSQAEVTFLLAHLWELRGVPFDYFYFDENCSFHILTLLDVLRPEDPFSKKLLPWVVPVDALKVVVDAPGAVIAVSRRLSQASAMRQKLSVLSTGERQAVAALGHGRQLPTDESVIHIPDERRAIVFEAAYDYVNYLEARGDIAAAERPQRLYDLLAARSTVPLSVTLPPPQVAHPEAGHDSRRLSLGSGVHSRRGSFAAMQFRGAYHSLDDNPSGYVPGLEIALIDGELRNYAHQLRLQSLDLVRVFSIFPNDSLVQKVSWGARLGWAPPLLSKGDGLVAGLEAAVGYGARIGQAGLLYGLGTLRGEAGSGGGQVGVGTLAGTVVELGDSVRFLARIRMFEKLRSGAVDLRYQLSPCDGLLVGVRREIPYGENGSVWSLTWQRYF
jgi:hypothetical protein